jgi:hypothetical protein
LIRNSVFYNHQTLVHQIYIHLIVSIFRAPAPEQQSCDDQDSLSPDPDSAYCEEDELLPPVSGLNWKCEKRHKVGLWCGTGKFSTSKFLIIKI